PPPERELLLDRLEDELLDERALPVPPNGPPHEPPPLQPLPPPSIWPRPPRTSSSTSRPASLPVRRTGPHTGPRPKPPEPNVGSERCELYVCCCWRTRQKALALRAPMISCVMIVPMTSPLENVEPGTSYCRRVNSFRTSSSSERRLRFAAATSLSSAMVLACRSLAASRSTSRATMTSSSG